MKKIIKFLFGTFWRTATTTLASLIGVTSGTIGIYQFFSSEVYDFSTGVILLDSVEETHGYDKSAGTAINFISRSEQMLESGQPFFFLGIITDYRLSGSVEGIEDVGVHSETEFSVATTGLMNIYYSPGCSQWEVGECTHLIVEFDLPGHEEVYGTNTGVGAEDASRSNPALTTVWGDSGELFDANGTLGPRRFTFDFSNELGGEFVINVTEDTITFYSYSVPARTGGGAGIQRFRMIPEASDPAIFRRTLNRAAEQLRSDLKDLRGF